MLRHITEYQVSDNVVVAFSSVKMPKQHHIPGGAEDLKMQLKILTTVLTTIYYYTPSTCLKCFTVTFLFTDHHTFQNLLVMDL